MAASNTGAAYNLPAYQAVPVQKPKTQPRLRVVRGPRQFLVACITPRSLCVFAMAITVICLMVYNQVCLTEITGEINDLENDLKIMKAESHKIESELEAAVSFRAIAEQAEYELGLQKLDKYQTHPVYLYQEDKIEVVESTGDAGIMEEARLAMNYAVNTLKEYIAGE